jgi:hypothetical protein
MCSAVASHIGNSANLTRSSFLARSVQSSRHAFRRRLDWLCYALSAMPGTRPLGSTSLLVHAFSGATVPPTTAWCTTFVALRSPRRPSASYRSMPVRLLPCRFVRCSHCWPPRPNGLRQRFILTLPCTPLTLRRMARLVPLAMCSLPVSETFGAAPRLACCLSVFAVFSLPGRSSVQPGWGC